MTALIRSLKRIPGGYMSDSFAIQASYKFGDNNNDMLNVRGNSLEEFAHNLRNIANGIPDLIRVGDMLRQAPTTHEQAVATIQQAFPGGQVISDESPQVVNVPLPEPEPPANPWGAQAPPQAPAPPQQAASAAQCPACSRATACPDCGGATGHRQKPSARKGQSYNAHMCLANASHKVVWCKTPIPAALQGVLNNPALIYG